MTTFDLESTYLGLDGAGGVTAVPGGPAFWKTVHENPAALRTLITVGTGDGDWKQWEMHPHGDEVLIVLEGSVRMVFERDGGEETHDISAGATLIVPAGTWHTARGQKNLRMLFMTFGKGTDHKPV